MSFHYRYRCTQEQAYVFETRDETLGPPTVCVNDGAALEAGSLTIVEEPHFVGDIQLISGQEFDVTGANIEGLSHTSLIDIGTNTHAQIDTHIADATKHRQIDDNSTSSTTLWSSSKVTTELATKTNTGHAHVAANISDFDTAVSSNSTVAASVTHAANTSNPHAVTKSQVGLSNVQNIKDNFAATSAPSTTDDSALLYSVGSVWINTTTGRAYVCVDPSPSAAVWRETSITTTTNIPEGSNLFYTDARFDTRLAAKTTTNLAEGNNLYYTESRVSANSAVAASTAHAASTSNPHSVTKAQVGLSEVANLKVNLAASTAPTASDDSGSGYAVGSRWIDTTADREYVCVDATAAAAVWRRTDITDHTLLSNVGTNTHAQIDTHIADTSAHLTTGAQNITGVKTFLSAPSFSAISNGGTVTLPSGTRTLVARDTVDTLCNKKLYDSNCYFVCDANETNQLRFNVNGGGNHIVELFTEVAGTSTDNIYIPNTSGATGRIVLEALAQTLTNKTLTAPVIASISNSGTVTLPTGTRTLVARDTTDTLTNKTLTAPIIATIVNGGGTLTVPTSTDTLVARNTTDTLTNKTLTGTTNTIRATQLGTTGSDVVFSSAAPPAAAGYVPVTTSSTAVAWQLLSALTWRNAWNSGTSYVVNDVVSSGNACWICISAHTNQVPPNATYWNQVVDGFHWKGAWSSQNYIVNDVVLYNGSSYVCITNTVSNENPSNGNYWSVFASASASGSSTQVQYNLSGALTGTSKLIVDADEYPVVGDKSGDAPAVPSSGVKLFARYCAGRRMLGQVGPTGLEYAFQPTLYAQKIGFWTAQGNGTTVTAINFGATNTGTLTTRNVATTRLFTSMRRLGFLTATTAGSSAGTRHALLQFFRGNGNEGEGGFFYVARFGISSAATVAGQRSFVGLYGSASVIGNVEPSSLVNIVGFGVDTADSSWTFMHNDGTGTAVKETLTGTFPARSLSVDMMEVRIFCAPNSASIGYSMRVMGTGGSFFEGSVTTDIPAATQLLSPQVWTNNSTTALAAGIDVVNQYIETDN